MAYVGLDRGIREHWIYQDAEYFKVWFEMLFLARFSREPHNELVDGEIIIINYSEFLYGRIKWSERLKISEQRLRTLIAKLKKEKMIELVSEHRKCSKYTIVNYEKFNQQSNQQRSQSQQAIEECVNQQDNHPSTSSQPAANQQPTTKEEGSKKVKTEKKVKEEVIKTLYGDFVQMTSIQYDNLLKDLGEDVTNKYILSIDDWFAQDNSRLKKYSDHSRMVRTWKRNDDLKGNPQSFNRLPPKGKGTPPSEIEQFYLRKLKEEQENEAI